LHQFNLLLITILLTQSLYMPNFWGRLRYYIFSREENTCSQTQIS